MTVRNRNPKGFTLVEILIVVVILGILAAIVIPQFTSASESAKASSLESQLQTIRSQLELYQIQHNGDYPTALQMWVNLLTETEVDGSAGDSSGNEFGPYLQQPPTNSFELSSTIGVAGAGVGWVYTEATGAIMAVVEATKAAELFLDTTNDVVTY